MSRRILLWVPLCTLAAEGQNHHSIDSCPFLHLESRCFSFLFALYLFFGKKRPAVQSRKAFYRSGRMLWCIFLLYVMLQSVLLCDSKSERLSTIIIFKGRSASGGIPYGYCYGKTYTEAKQNVEYAKRNFENTETHNAVPEQKPMHWYCDSWLQTNRLRLRDSTYIKYRGFLDHHINPLFGNLLPAEISSQTASAFSDLLLETKACLSRPSGIFFLR